MPIWVGNEYIIITKYASERFNRLLRIKESVKSDNDSINAFVESWSFTFEDLELFKERNLIDKESFDYWIEEIKKILPKQCVDTRLINLIWIDWKSLWITESKLKKYYEKWYINLDEVKNCYNLLPKEMKDLTIQKEPF